MQEPSLEACAGDHGSSVDDRARWTPRAVVYDGGVQFGRVANPDGVSFAVPPLTARAARLLATLYRAAAARRCTRSIRTPSQISSTSVPRLPSARSASARAMKGAASARRPARR